MNSDQLKGKWTEIQGQAKSRWGELTDDDVKEVQGDREALEGKIQQAYGRDKEEARREVDDFLAGL